MGHNLGYGVGGDERVEDFVEVLLESRGVDEEVEEGLVDLLEGVFGREFLEDELQVYCL